MHAEIVKRLFEANPNKVKQALRRPSLRSWFVGQAMKETGGSHLPEIMAEVTALFRSLQEKDR